MDLSDTKTDFLYYFVTFVEVDFSGCFWVMYYKINFFKLTFFSFIRVSSILLCNSSLLLFCSASLICLAAAEHLLVRMIFPLKILFLFCLKLLTYCSSVSLVCTPLSPSIADTVGGAGQTLVITSRQRLKVGLHESFSSSNLINTFHTRILRKSLINIGPCFDFPSIKNIQFPWWSLFAENCLTLSKIHTSS